MYTAFACAPSKQPLNKNIHHIDTKIKHYEKIAIAINIVVKDLATNQRRIYSQAINDTEEKRGIRNGMGRDGER